MDTDAPKLLKCNGNNNAKCHNKTFRAGCTIVI